MADNALRALFDKINEEKFEAVYGRKLPSDIPLFWIKSTTRGGQCRWNRRNGILVPTIEISEYLPIEQLPGTMLHEMIHAFLPVNVGHKYEFQVMASRLEAPLKCVGLREKAMEDTNGLAFPYISVCPSCKREKRYQRKPTRERSCGICCPGVYNPKYKLIIRKLTGLEIVTRHMKGS